MIKIKEAIVVEGNYDKIKLASIVDTMIITTDGFAIFNNKEKTAFLRRLADTCGIIVLTDADRAGFMIRNHIKQGMEVEAVKHAYIPDIIGKERRKRQASKEGTLGVEGMEAEVIIAALRAAGATFEDESVLPVHDERRVTKADFFAAGLTGGAGSADRRRKLARELGLPSRISANMLIDAINVMGCVENMPNIEKMLDNGAKR